jgi:hypothetical protein
MEEVTPVEAPPTAKGLRRLWARLVERRYDVVGLSPAERRRQFRVIDGGKA